MHADDAHVAPLSPTCKPIAWHAAHMNHPIPLCLRTAFGWPRRAHVTWERLQEMAFNENLQHELERVFKPMGLVAYSNCCRWGCTGAYDEDDAEFVPRNKGIYFIRLHLNGMNYRPEVQTNL